MSVNYWIGAKCPWCCGMNGEHTEECRFINRVVLDKKPLRWRTGLPGKEMNGQDIVVKRVDKYGDHYYLGKYWSEDKELSMCCGQVYQRLLDETRWLPLSEILALVEE